MYLVANEASNGLHFKDCVLIGLGLQAVAVRLLVSLECYLAVLFELVKECDLELMPDEQHLLTKTQIHSNRFLKLCTFMADYVYNKL